MQRPSAINRNENCMSCTMRTDSSFCNLPMGDLKAFDAIKLATAYPVGAVLFSEGDAARGIFVLCKGRVKLTMTSSNGKVIILRIAQPGEVLALHSVISNAPLQASAETVEPSQINFVRREDFMRFLREHSQAAIRTALQLSTSYETACEQVRSLALAPSAHGKLARFLLEWCGRGQHASQDGCAKLTLTHEEIGQMIGISRETVTRTLGEFKTSRLVVLKGSTLLIPNKSALQNMAGD
jgi:CRP/FNR family transcriptional regulator, cyclic AMP receptor protein